MPKMIEVRPSSVVGGKGTSRQFCLLDRKLLIEIHVASSTGNSEAGPNTRCFIYNYKDFPVTGG